MALLAADPRQPPDGCKSRRWINAGCRFPCGIFSGKSQCGSSCAGLTGFRGGNAVTPAGDFASIVRLEGVQKYFGAVHALRDIDLYIGSNEIVGLIGDNGAGKSTLIKVMTGVLEPSSGKIFVREREIQPGEYSVRMAHDL